MSAPLPPSIVTPYGSSPQVPLSLFFDHILPPLRPGLNAGKIVEHLRTVGHKSSRIITKARRWRGCPFAPVRSPRENGKAFDFIPKVDAAIRRACEVECAGVRPYLTYRNNTKGRLVLSEDRDEESTPDAGLYRDGEDSYAATGVAIEYKKDDTKKDVEDNVAKICGSMTNCMRSDPRRRFVYGFTIENANMRLWYCDRSQTLASAPFDFTEDHESFVYSLLAIKYAEPHELGWDPTIRSLGDSGQHDITVHCSDGQVKVYRTMELLAQGAMALRSKGTRVWKAVELKDGRESGEPVVLKDAWVEVTRPQEGEITEAVRAAVGLDSTAHNALLTVQCHGDVFLDDERTVLDCTRLLLTKDGVVSAAPAPQRHSSARIDAAYTPMSRCLVHYRIVFAEVCSSISEETSLVTLFRALADIAQTLQAMHRCGWVHRDISIANVMLDSTGRGRLVDLEYAKRQDSEPEGFLGTQLFMAVEVARQGFMHRPLLVRSIPPEERLSPRTLTLAGLGDKEARQKAHALAERYIFFDIMEPLEKPPEFRYNSLHDMESLWWIAVFLVVRRRAENIPGDHDPIAVEVQRRYAAMLFGDDWRSLDARHTALCGRGSGTFGDYIGALHPSMHVVGKLLNDLRLSMIAAYEAAETDAANIDYSVADALHQPFAEAFTAIAQNEELQGGRLRRFTYAGEAVSVDESCEEDSVTAPSLGTRTQPQSRARAGTKRTRRTREPAGGVRRYNLRPRKRPKLA